MADAKFVTKISKKSIQRVSLVFLCFCLALSPLQPAAAYALPQNLFKKNPSVLPSSPVSIAESQAVSEPAPTLDQLELKKEYSPKNRTVVGEEADKRTSNSKTLINSDGSRTLDYSVVPKHYQKDGKWVDLNPKLSDDLTYKSTKEIADKDIFSNPFNPIPQAFKTKSGEVSSKLMPFEDGVEIQFKDKKFTIAPQFARNVQPKVETINDHKIITYKNAWPHVDVTYELVGNALKETLILKSGEAQNAFIYKTSEGTKVTEHPTIKGALAIEGIDAKEFFIAPLSINVNERGIISEERAKWAIRDQTIALIVDGEWLDAQPEKSFPIAVDPSFYNDVGGTYGNFLMYKSDGYSCNNQICDPQAGTLYDNGWKHWRTMFRIPFDQLQGKRLLNSHIKLIKKQRSYWTGGNEHRYFNTWWGPCFGFHCYNAESESPYGLVSTGEWLNNAKTVDWMMRNGQWGGWMMLNGENVPYTTYKQFEPTELGMQVDYDTPPPVANAVNPANNQVTINPQPTLRVNPVTDAEGEQVSYYFRVSTGSDAETGAVINSGWSTSTQWTVPEGVLQDGTTYYWRVYTKSGPETVTKSDWVRSFKVDLRTGKDSTQAYDTVGPVGIDLATGNATTSAGTHTMSALGGNIGLSFDYDSPVSAKNGLIGEYWNVNEGYAFASGAPTVAPNLKQADQDVNFNWGESSPGPGVNANWFYARWKGYFIAPTSGDYYFGGAADDAISVYIDGNEVTRQGCCGATPGYASTPISLKAGQAIPIRVEAMDATSIATAKVYVKGAVSERIIPREWLRTEPQATVSQYGLTGRYYTLNPERTFPTDNSDPMRFMMARHDTKLSFNWGLSGPAPGLQADDFMVRWTGYITVPETGSYTFGASSDDGVSVKIGASRAEAIPNRWTEAANTTWGTPLNFDTTQPIPITVEYFERGGGASFNLLVRGPNTPDQEIPVKWLTPKAAALPDAWRLGVDVDGDVSYERLRVVGSNVVLEDSTRQTHEYKWTNGGYTPPVNEDGTLTRNADNTFTFVDVDGRTYIFSAEGKLTSVTTPQDDRQPAALQYKYDGDPSRLMKIVDGVTDQRYGELHYATVNDSACSVPSGFDPAPAGMLCAFTTSDGDVTKLYYKNNQLARVEKPGNEVTDFGYDSLGRMVATRDSMANDAIVANVRADNDKLNTTLSYDQLGRVSSITAPAPTEGAARINHTYEYQAGGAGELSVAVGAGTAPVTTPVSASWGGDRIDQVARGASNDLIHRYYENGVWSAWASQGGCITDSPAITSWGQGRLDVFVRGCNTSGNNLHHKAFDNNQWYGWDQPTSNSIFIVGSPSATSWGYQRLDFVARGANGELYHGYWTPGSGWGGLGSLGGCVNSPTIVSPGYEQLDIYVVDCGTSGDNVHLKTWRPVAGWSPYILQNGARVESMLGATSSGVGTVIAARSADGSLKVRKNSTTPWQTIEACTADRPSVSAHANYAKIFYRSCGTQDVSQVTFYPSSGATAMHVTGAAEPSGFSKKVEYDALLRTVKDTNIANQSSKTEWDSVKDLILSTTDATGLKSTTIYDQLDRPIDSYGPAPSAWYGADRRPLPAYASQVPRTSSGYDEGITGLALSVYNNAKLLRTPKLITTGMTNLPYGSYGLELTNTSVTPTDGLSARAIGKIRLDKVGTYSFKVWHSDGARVYLDNQLISNDWADGGERFSPVGTYNNATAGKYVPLIIEFYKKGSTGTGVNGRLFASLNQLEPGSSTWTEEIGGQYTPAYGLATSQTAYDAEKGEVATKTNYSNPAYGTISSTILDPSGLNYTSYASYEAPGQGLLRQLSKTLPGGTVTEYQYYGAADLRDNPCTSSVESDPQAGRPKMKVETDPDGSGPQTSRISETIYNHTGAVVATRYNNDPWSCNEHDARDRIVRVVIPARENKASRTIVSNHAVGGNPLVKSTSDEAGTVRVESDLLGRTVKYVDAKGKITTSNYDTFGKLTSRTSELGIESYEYDSIDRLTKHKLDGITYATITYDQYSRIATVQYPTGINLSSISRDDLGRESGNTYTLSTGQVLTDSIARYTSGDIKQGSENGVNKTYDYDKAGRLISATIGGNNFSYEFGAQDTTCTTLPGYNANANKNGNRTKLTVNGSTTTYCYDRADRLIASSDPTLTNPTYDDHGNTLSLGDGVHKTEYGYDTSDRNVSIKSGDKETMFVRDAQGRIVSREHKHSGQTVSSVSYGFTGSGDAPDFLLNSVGEVIQKYITLPGDVLVTIKPQSTSAGATTYSLPNIHGDIFATVDADGALMSTHMTGPFGEVLPSQPAPMAGATTQTLNPLNTASGTTYNYVGQHQKMTDLETSPILGGVVQMGARVYIPSLGRFLQVDSVEGGTDNNYVYANDPVNEYDLGGNVVETAVDAAGVGYDAYELYKKPSWGNAGMLAWSVGATLLPFVPGSYVGRAGAAAFKASKGAPPAMTKKSVSASAKPKAVTAKNSVYVGKNPQTGRINYVGITSRKPQARFNEHARSASERAHLRYEVVKKNLTRAEARRVEQNYINRYGLRKNGGQLYNKINSIRQRR